MKRKWIAVLLLFVFFLPGCSKEKPEDTEPIKAVSPSDRVAISNSGDVNELIKKDPQNPNLWYQLAVFYERESKPQEAVEALKKATSLNPKMGPAYCKLGDVYNRLRKYNDAVVSLNMCIELIPNNAVAYNNIAYTYGILKNTDKQISSLKTAIKLKPDYAIAIYNLGMVSLNTGNVAGAKKQHAALKGIDEKLAGELAKAINTAASGKKLGRTGDKK